MKTCTVCKKEKSLDSFYNCKGKKDGKGYRCKSCDNLARAKWSRENPGRARDSAKYRNIKCKYGLSRKKYDNMWIKQHGACLICFSDDESRYVVDHCHESGKVRGILCNACNVGIGQLRDDPELLKSALNYLETH